MKVLFVILVLPASLATCSCSKAIVAHNNRIYVGTFTLEVVSYPTGRYTKLDGFGISLGFFAFGLGYYDLKTLRIDKGTPSKIESPIATVWIDQELHLIEPSRKNGGQHE